MSILGLSHCVFHPRESLTILFQCVSVISVTEESSCEESGLLTARQGKMPRNLFAMSVDSASFSTSSAINKQTLSGLSNMFQNGQQFSQRDDFLMDEY